MILFTPFDISVFSSCAIELCLVHQQSWQKNVRVSLNPETNYFIDYSFNHRWTLSMSCHKIGHASGLPCFPVSWFLRVAQVAKPVETLRCRSTDVCATLFGYADAEWYPTYSVWQKIDKEKSQVTRAWHGVFVTFIFYIFTRCIS